MAYHKHVAQVQRDSKSVGHFKISAEFREALGYEDLAG